jgi:hypothetical protein
MRVGILQNKPNSHKYTIDIKSHVHKDIGTMINTKCGFQEDHKMLALNHMYTKI